MMNLKNIVLLALTVLTLSTVAIHGTGGFFSGTVVDFAPWIGNSRGGLKFPIYNSDIYEISPKININEVCESTLTDLINKTRLDAETNGTCEHCSDTDKVLCQRSIDFEFLRSVQSMTSLFVVDYSRNNFNQNSSLDIQNGFLYDNEWKTTIEIFSNAMGIGMRVSADLSLNPTGSYLSMEGDTFSNELRVGWKFQGQIFSDLDGKVHALGRTIETDSGWELNITAEYAQGSVWNVKGFITVDFLMKTLSLEGTLGLNSETFSSTLLTGSVKLKEIPLEWVISGSFTSVKYENYTIPAKAFSGLKMKHIFFKDSYFLRDFDTNAFEDVIETKTLTFANSKLEEVPNLDELLVHLPGLEAIYIENCTTPDLVFGESLALTQVELLSFKGSGLLTLKKGVFKIFADGNLIYLNLQDSNLKLPSLQSGILKELSTSLRYLDLSYTSLSNEDELSRVLDGLQVTHLSLAGLQLDRTPMKAFASIQYTIEYLTLRGNNFKKIPDVNMLSVVLNFPEMPKLRELDLQNCEINFIEKGTFDMFPSLDRLYLAHNSIENLQDGWFGSVPSVTYLDLSNNAHTGLAVKSTINLANFQNLKVLDLSNGVFGNIDAVVLGLPSSLKGLSLSNTGLKNLTNNLFANLNNLSILDLSDNTQLSIPMNSTLLESLNSLRFLSLRNCRLTFVIFNRFRDNATSLPNLEFLDLSINNIKTLEPFRRFPKLKKIDLSSNSIDAWYQPILTQFTKIETIYLNDNKIDDISPAMFDDILKLREVKLGNNPFSCGCYVNEFTEKVPKENKGYICGKFGLLRKHSLKTSVPENVFIWRFNNSSDAPEQTTTPRIPNSSLIVPFDPLTAIQKKIMDDVPLGCLTQINNENQHKTHIKNCVLISDWGEENYQCFSEDLQVQVPFNQNTLNLNCTVEEFKALRSEFMTFVYIGGGIFLVIGIFAGLFYWKWWDIKLISRAVKEAAVMAVLNKQDYEPVAFQYNVFVSYSDKDRTWVLENLLPSLESWKDFKVCLHERDFQVGLSILENIIASIDKSQTVILVLSLSYVRSQWCQFEMLVAQHRLLETHRDKLILVLLEHIPKRIRPKALQYLMMTKTYVQWPGNMANQTEIDAFWDRVFKALLESNATLSINQ